MSVCQLIVRMMLPDTEGLSPAARNALRVKTIADPAGSGTGRMLLLASNVSLSLHGIERDAPVSYTHLDVYKRQGQELIDAVVLSRLGQRVEGHIPI